MIRPDLQPLIAALKHEGVTGLRFNVPLSTCSYWRIGGPAALMIEPRSIAEVQTVVRTLQPLDVPHVIIGDGCNVLFDDAGFYGAVLHIGRTLADVQCVGTRLTVEGGAYVPNLARLTAGMGLAGLEHTVGIPGTIGGLILMNGGSLRHGVGENIVWVETVTNDGSLKRLTRKQCQFSYRHSALQGTGAVVVRAQLNLTKGDRQAIRQTMLDILKERRTKFPRLPSCGSVFLNAPDLYAAYGAPGKVVEETGLKGTRRGQIEVSPQHANFMVNHGGGTSKEVLSLIRHVREKVHQRTGYWLKCEVRHIAPDGVQQQAHLSAEALVDE